MLYDWLSKQDIKVIACPHGNRRYKGYRIHKRFKRHYDYSFVFGKKEQRQLAKINKESSKNLIRGGIPSNDALKNYSRKNKYILVIPNITDPEQIHGPIKGFKAFTRKVFDKLKLVKLSDKYNCPIIIKEKNKLYHNSSFLRKSMKGYPVEFMLDCADDNQLIADACCVISAPSTMAFKPIQMGIPTVLLHGHGMTGNFYDFIGLVDSDCDNVHKCIKRQKGKQESFIKNTLDGGLEFNASEIYMSRIVDLLKER